MGKRLYNSLSEAIESRTHKAGEDECWRWTGSFNTAGYGQITRGGVNLTAHRSAFEIANGPIEAGMYICHTCDNKWCVNPKHLFAGTPSDNMDDKVRKGRQFKGEALSMALKASVAYRESIKRGEDHHQSKLTNAQRDEILGLLSGPLSQREIGRIYGVSQGTISWVKMTYKARAA